MVSYLYIYVHKQLQLPTLNGMKGIVNRLQTLICLQANRLYLINVGRKPTANVYDHNCDWASKNSPSWHKIKIHLVTKC